MELCSKIRLLKEDINDVTTSNIDCDYYDTSELNYKTLNSDNCFSVFHSNICSLQANVDKLEHLLSQVSCKFDIISLTETWNPLATSHLFSPGIIKGYHCYDGITGSSSNGGVVSSSHIK